MHHYQLCVQKQLLCVTIQNYLRTIFQVHFLMIEK